MEPDGDGEAVDSVLGEPRTEKRDLEMCPCGNNIVVNWYKVEGVVGPNHSQGWNFIIDVYA